MATALRTIIRCLRFLMGTERHFMRRTNIIGRAGVVTVFASVLHGAVVHFLYRKRCFA